MWLTARSSTGIRPSRTVAGTRLTTLLTALPAALLLAACSSPVFAPVQSGELPTGAKPRPVDRIHRQAQDALVRWADAVRESGGATITFIGALTGQIGEWDEDDGDRKLALAAGLVEAVTDMSSESPGRREVKWLDDSEVDVNVLSAAATFEALVAGGAGECPECTPLRVTEASLATGLAETSRGPAEVPMWVFGLAGTSVRITRVAVDESVTVVPPPWNADDPPVGTSIDWARGSPDSRDLEVGFVGRSETGRCAEEYTGEAVESELAVVVIITGRPTADPDGPTDMGSCRLAGSPRTVNVRLADPLGDRVVLEVRQGLPVPIEPPA